jgi:hypothetical protein
MVGIPIACKTSGSFPMGPGSSVISSFHLIFILIGVLLTNIPSPSA